MVLRVKKYVQTGRYLVYLSRYGSNQFVYLYLNSNISLYIYIYTRISEAIAYTFASRKPASSGPASLQGEAAEKDLILAWHVLSVGVHMGNDIDI